MLIGSQYAHAVGDSMLIWTMIVLFYIQGIALSSVSPRIFFSSGGNVGGGECIATSVSGMTC